jgi:DNA-binding SARP family transcriptional activator
VLGPLTVHADTGVPLSLGTPKQRTVCALLLTSGGELVTVDQIVDELWPDHPPSSAVANTRTYVAKLRRALSGSESGVLIKSHQSGYVVQITPTDFDLHVFRDLTVRGRGAAAQGDWAGAAEHFDTALRLWRGASALVDVRLGPMLAARCVGAQDERVAAVEDLAAVRIAMDQAALAVANLREHVRVFPLRERGWELLMTALHQTGDTAGALTAYWSARAALVEQLGVEPGPKLRELQQAVLQGEPAGRQDGLLRIGSVMRAQPPSMQPPGVPPPPGPGRPAQLPADVPAFTGRREECIGLDDVLSGGEASVMRLVAITGAPGMGKTALAVHWGHQVRDRFPDGQLFVNLHGYSAMPALRPLEAMSYLLTALGVPGEQVPSTVEPAAAVYRSLLADRRMLVLLDNAGDAEQVRPLLPGSAGCAVLVTSRDQLSGLVAGDGAHPLTLGPITTDEARALLTRRLGADRVLAEPQAVDDVIDHCAGLPLALTIAAARAAARPQFRLAAIADELREARGGLDAFTGADPATDLRAVFSWSYRTLPTDAARLFRLLGLHPGPTIATAAAASLVGLPIGQVHPLLAELTRAHLLSEHAPARFTFHDLLRAYAVERGRAEDREPDRQAAIDRLYDHHLDAAA